MTPWRTNPIPYDGSNYIRTGVSQAQSTIPNTYSLAQNYPNPFNPSTTIEYTLPIRSNVTIKIYSILGQEVATLINNEQSAGYYQTVWNASRLASGMYFLRISAQSVDGTQPSFTQVKKMLLMK
jgi:flagellar hook assembly protein FlgD